MARASRILPVYFFGLALDSPSFVAGALKTGATASSVAWILGVLLACVFLIQAWIPRLVLLWNGPGWSLSGEAFFYAVFPYALAPFRRSPRGTLLLLLLLLQVAALAAPVCAMALGLPGLSSISASESVPDGNWPNFLKFFPLFRLPEFLFGMVLGILFCRSSAVALKTRVVRLAITLAGVVSVLAICNFCVPYGPYLLFHNGLLLVPFSALIFGLAHSDSTFARVLSGKWLDTLGCASYALYIIHVPMIHYVQALGRRLQLQSACSGYELLALLLLFVILSVVLWRYFEEPARKSIMRGTGRRDWPTKSSALSCCRAPVPLRRSKGAA